MTPLASSAALLADSDHWHGPGWWIVFPIFWFLFLVGVVSLIFFGVRRNRREAGMRSGEARLAERYAAGEIDETEYRSRRAVLRERP